MYGSMGVIPTLTAVCHFIMTTLWIDSAPPPTYPSTSARHFTTAERQLHLLLEGTNLAKIILHIFHATIDLKELAGWLSGCMHVDMIDMTTWGLMTYCKQMLFVYRNT